MENQYYFCLYKTDDEEDANRMSKELTSADIIHEVVKVFHNGEFMPGRKSLRFAFKTSEEAALIEAFKRSGHYDWFKSAYPKFIEGTY